MTTTEDQPFTIEWTTNEFGHTNKRIFLANDIDIDQGVFCLVNAEGDTVFSTPVTRLVSAGVVAERFEDRYIDIVLSGDEPHLEFVEVEDWEGKGISLGRRVDREALVGPDNLTAIRVTLADFVKAVTRPDGE